MCCGGWCCGSHCACSAGLCCEGSGDALGSGGEGPAGKIASALPNSSGAAAWGTASSDRCDVLARDLVNPSSSCVSCWSSLNAAGSVLGGEIPAAAASAFASPPRAAALPATSAQGASAPPAPCPPAGAKQETGSRTSGGPLRSAIFVSDAWSPFISCVSSWSSLMGGGLLCGASLPVSAWPGASPDTVWPGGLAAGPRAGGGPPPQGAAPARAWPPGARGASGLP
mmetsp:Transcript_79280/g.224425  ORF Transcript_79280/g.224425 Transcript_79280/m.224425 type:complete len:226 (+) Transcript_79280:1159-1836(+)